MLWNFLVSVLLTDASIVLYDGNPGTPDMGVLCDLSALRNVGSTGSPLAPEGFEWIYEHVGRDTWLFSTSGGTDVCSAFVGGVPILPVYLGELQARSLGADLHAFDEEG